MGKNIRPKDVGGDGYLAPELICSVILLSALLDKLHRKSTIYSSVVERLVRRIVVLEAGLDKEMN